MKHLHRYRFFSLRLLCLLLFFLTGCRSADSAAQDPPASPSSQETDPLTFHTVTLTLPELEQDHTILFLTDTHAVLPSPSGLPGSSPEIEQYSEERIQHFISEGGTPSSDLFSVWTDRIHNGKELSADAILLGGDIIDSPSSVNLDLLKTFLEGLPIPYLYTPGNHDWTYPWEYMTDTGRTLYLSELLPYMDHNSSIHSLELEDLILVAIDNSSNQIHPDALQEYRHILSLGKPVVVLLHVPLYTPSVLEKTMEKWGRGIILGGGVHGGIYPDPVSTEFLYLTTAADSPVAAVLAGHIHLFDQSYIEGEKNILQITGPAGYQGEAVLLHLKQGS